LNCLWMQDLMRPSERSVRRSRTPHRL
jgi:hypothetical protein